MADPADHIAAIRTAARYFGFVPEHAIMSDSTSSTTTSFQFNPRAKPFIPGALVHPPVPAEVFRRASSGSSTFVFNPEAPPFYPLSGAVYSRLGMHEQPGFLSYNLPPTYYEGPAVYGESIGLSSFDAYNLSGPATGYIIPSEYLRFDEHTWRHLTEWNPNDVQHVDQYFQSGHGQRLDYDPHPAYVPESGYGQYRGYVPQSGYAQHPGYVQRASHVEYAGFVMLPNHHPEQPQQFTCETSRATSAVDLLTPKNGGQLPKIRKRKAKRTFKKFRDKQAESVRNEPRVYMRW